MYYISNGDNQSLYTTLNGEKHYYPYKEKILNIDASNLSNFIVNNNVIAGLSPSIKKMCLKQGCNLINNWPSDIVTIGQDAFNSNNLYKLPIAWNKINTINPRAFKGNKIAVLPSFWGNIITIGANAFEDNFISILPSKYDNIRNIGDEAFKNNRLVYIGEKSWTTEERSTTNNGGTPQPPKANTVRYSLRYHTDMRNTCQFNFYSASGSARLLKCEENYEYDYITDRNYMRVIVDVEYCYGGRTGKYYVGDIRVAVYSYHEGSCDMEYVKTTTHYIFDKISSIGNNVFSNNKVIDFKGIPVPNGKTLSQIGLTGPGNNNIITINTANFNTYFNVNAADLAATIKPEYANNNYYHLTEIPKNIKTLTALNTTIVKLPTKWNNSTENIKIEGLFCTIPSTIPENAKSIQLIGSKTCNTPNQIIGDKENLNIDSPNEILAPFSSRYGITKKHKSKTPYLYTTLYAS